MGCSRHEARVDNINAYGISMGRLKEKRALGRGEDNIKTNLREIALVEI
jgi:hypothetical protein